MDVRLQNNLATTVYMTSEPSVLATPAIDQYLTMAAPQTAPDMPAASGVVDAYVGKQVVLLAGKYKGRQAYVERKVKKKWRLLVEGVPYALEFYENRFALASDLR